MSFEAQKLGRKEKKKEKIIIAYPLKDARELKSLFEKKRNTEILRDILIDYNCIVLIRRNKTTITTRNRKINLHRILQLFDKLRNWRSFIDLCSFQKRRERKEGRWRRNGFRLL